MSRKQADVFAVLERDGMFDAGDVIFWATDMDTLVLVTANAVGRPQYDRACGLACEWEPTPNGFPAGWLVTLVGGNQTDPVDSDKLALQMAKEACADGMRAIAYVGSKAIILKKSMEMV